MLTLIELLASIPIGVSVNIERLNTFYEGTVPCGNYRFTVKFMQNVEWFEVQDIHLDKSATAYDTLRIKGFLDRSIDKVKNPSKYL